MSGSRFGIGMVVVRVGVMHAVIEEIPEAAFDKAIAEALNRIPRAADPR